MRNAIQKESVAKRDLIPEQLAKILACPSDQSRLSAQDEKLVCERGHTFPIEGGIPIFTEAVRREAVPRNMAPGPEEAGQPNDIDAFVNDWLVNTNGNLYRRVRGRLRRYPIPEWPFGGTGAGRIVLDVGSSWGRWSVAAARAGWSPVGLDVHIDALQAAQRVSRQLGVKTAQVCGDVEALPFWPGSIDVVFSYSVLQHVERRKVLHFFEEAARVLKPGGLCLVQLPNVFGLYSLFRQAKRRFRDAAAGTFEMRYWTRGEIRHAIERAKLRNLHLRADGFFSQNPQISDLDLLSPWARLIVLASRAGRTAADRFPPLVGLADSLWVEAEAPSKLG